MGMKKFLEERTLFFIGDEKIREVFLSNTREIYCCWCCMLLGLVGVWLVFGWCLVGVWLVFGWCLVGVFFIVNEISVNFFLLQTS
jgi:hypothetical protein